MRTVKVPLGERSYAILIGRDLMQSLGEQCRRLGLGSRCVVVTDRKVERHYGALARKSLAEAGFVADTVVVPAGEASKSWAVVRQCYDHLARHQLERKSFVVALGGGVVGDLAGFVAATYLRGMDFVQVPTSLLAQVDSSVGGKVGINLKAGKNLVGAFHQPRLVLCDLSTLDTLPERELKAGMAEVIKYGIIRDAKLFRQLERDVPKLLSRESGVLENVVARCCRIKADVVQTDEKEGGLRAILNFGHTIGHAIENTAGYGTMLHGEAISLGQVAAAWLSRELTGLPRTEEARIEQLFERTGLPVRMPLTAAKRKRMMNAMRLDKKVQAGAIKFVLAKRIGRVVFGQQVAESWIDRAMSRIQDG